MMVLDRLGGTFGTLRWKLAASYVAVTLGVVLTIEAVLLIVLGLVLYFSPLVPYIIATGSSNIATSLAPAYADPQRTPEQLGQALLQTRYEAGSGTRVEFGPQGTTVITGTRSTQPETTNPLDRIDTEIVVLLDQASRVITSTRPLDYPSGQPLPPNEPAADLIQRAQSGVTSAWQLGGWTSDRQPIGVAPVLSDNGEVLGFVYLRNQEALAAAEPLVALLQTLLVSALCFLVLSAPVGLLFGLLAGRGITRRLNRLTQATSSFARGDLEQRVDDRSPDEIGQLARQFNSMAEQLTENVRSLRLLADQNAQLAERAGQLATVEERNRLARDLHDSVSQELFSLSMLAAAAKRQVATRPDAAQAQLDDIQQTAQHALQETRRLIFALRPAMLDDRGLGPAVRDLVAGIRERQGLDIDLRISGEHRLPLDQEQALFRIVQEALANVLRHSGQRRAEVDLTYADDQTCLTISDRGQGFDPNAPRSARSLGLVSMSERAAALGGNVTIESALDKGTTIRVILPAQ